MYLIRERRRDLYPFPFTDTGLTLSAPPKFPILSWYCDPHKFNPSSLETEAGASGSL